MTAAKEANSVIKSILDYILKLEYDSLPASTIRFVKLHLLDTLGAIIAGSKAECTGFIMPIVQKWGGSKEATVFVYGTSLPADCAALVNAIMARGYDFESLLGNGATHVPAAIIPAAFAFAEYLKNESKINVSGKELLAAITLGMDLHYRFRVAGGAATTMGGGWLAETFAPLAVAATGAKLLKLDPPKTMGALLMAYNQCAGNYGATIGEGGALVAQFGQGLSVRAGVISTLSAAHGLSAPLKDIFTSKWGLYEMYGGGYCDIKILTGNLGRQFSHLKPIIKRYPGCGGLQSAVHAMLSIINYHKIDAQNIRTVYVEVSPLNYEQVVRNRSFPSSPSEALWNMRFMLALAIAYGNVGPEHLSRNSLADDRVRSIYSIIEIVPNSNLRVEEVIVTLYTTDNSKHTLHLLETPPVSPTEIHDKFIRCCGFVALPSVRAYDIFQKIRNIEREEDVTTLIYDLVI